MVIQFPQTLPHDIEQFGEKKRRKIEKSPDIHISRILDTWIEVT